jgi:hypothetical protein
MCAPVGQRRRGTDMHQQDEEERARYAPAGLGIEGQMCTGRLKIRGIDAHQQAKGGEGQMCTSMLRIRGIDVHQQAKNKRKRCAPAS